MINTEKNNNLFENPVVDLKRLYAPFFRHNLDNFDPSYENEKSSSGRLNKRLLTIQSLNEEKEITRLN